MTDNELAYTSPSELKNNIEQVIEIQSDDFVEGFLIPIGDYVSQARTITGAARSKVVAGKVIEYVSFEIAFTGGFNNDAGQNFGSGQYPVKTWINTLPFQREGQVGFSTSAADYLKKVGYDVSQLKEKDAFLDAIEESQTLPVKLSIKWTNKTEKLGDGTYSKEFAKNVDFNVGSKEEPSYVPFFVKDGVKVEAKHRVGGFKRV